MKRYTEVIYLKGSKKDIILYDKIIKINDECYALMCMKDRLRNTPDTGVKSVCNLCSYEWFSSGCNEFKKIVLDLNLIGVGLCGTILHPHNSSLFLLSKLKKDGEIRSIK